MVHEHGYMTMVIMCLWQPTDVGRPELSEADMILFLGDFNYRLRGISYDEARDLVSQRCFDWLRKKDQLHAEMKAGKVFQGLREAQIKFPPTYKFERQKAGLSGIQTNCDHKVTVIFEKLHIQASFSYY